MLANQKYAILIVSVLLLAITSTLLVVLLRLASILARPRPQPDRSSNRQNGPTHLLVVLGSGGHTAEMLNILSSITDLTLRFTHRTYVVSSGDNFSAQKAIDFERQLDLDGHAYSVVTVRRARRVHQSFWSTPFTALLSLYDCFAVLRGTHLTRGQSLCSSPDLILTNGPGTGVCVVLASICLLFFRSSSSRGQMRTIFIESWARVKTLSLSGKILRFMVSRYLVQWPQLATDGAEYLGPLVS